MYAQDAKMRYAPGDLGLELELLALRLERLVQLRHLTPVALCWSVSIGV